jgi:hypothetical protein
MWYHERWLQNSLLLWSSRAACQWALGQFSMCGSYIFFELATCKALLVDLVVDLSSVVYGWSPFMGEANGLDLWLVLM